MAVVYLGLNIFISTKGKTLLCEILSQVIGKKVTVGSLNLVPLYGVSVNNLNIEGLFAAEKINAEPSLMGLFFGKVGFNKIIVTKPRVFIVRTGGARFNVNEIIDHVMAQNNPNQKINFFVKKLLVKNGKVSFQDNINNLSFDITPVELSVITSTLNFRTAVGLKAKAVSSDRRNVADISADGWLNFLRKDMDAKFSVQDIDAAYFSSYFGNLIKKVVSGKLFFTADMVSRNNDLAIDCHLETRDIRFSDEPLLADLNNKQITLFGNISEIVLDTLFGPGSGGIFDFSIHTKFDRPKLEGLQFKGNIFKEPLKNLIQGNIGKEGVEAVKKVGEDFKAIGKELKEQFKDVKDIFKVFKEKKEVEAPDPQESQTVSDNQ